MSAETERILAVLGRRYIGPALLDHPPIEDDSFPTWSEWQEGKRPAPREGRDYAHLPVEQLREDLGGYREWVREQLGLPATVRVMDPILPAPTIEQVERNRPEVDRNGKTAADRIVESFERSIVRRQSRRAAGYDYGPQCVDLRGIDGVSWLRQDEDPTRRAIGEMLDRVSIADPPTEPIRRTAIAEAVRARLTASNLPTGPLAHTDPYYPVLSRQERQR